MVAAKESKTERASRVTAINDAKSVLIARHKDEFDRLVEENMVNAGFVKQEVVRVIWTKPPSVKRQRIGSNER